MRSVVRGALAVSVPLIAVPWLPPAPILQDRPSATVVADRDGEPLRIFLSADERWRFPVRLAEVSPALRTAIVAAEDRWFYRHPGVNPLSLVRAAWMDLRARRVVAGGSTIPMQVTRMMNPRPRTLGAKLREILRAVALDRHHAKDELLEAYLNLAPFGANVEGVGAAAYFYFGKKPRELSLGEAALLTALPRAPNAYDPARHPEAARRARGRVLNQLEASGAFSRREITAARRQPLPAARRRPPSAAPHFAELVAAQFPGRARIVTTLDRRMQAVAEKQVAARIASLRAAGIHDAAVLVIENETRAVRAMVGSADFFGAGGQVNGALARRSPGSTLKPFLYARAFDDGRIAPDSFLLDIPTDFGGYVAENFDGRYRGRVTAREALVDSLNASAVRLLSDLGLGDFHLLLRRGGLATLDRPAAEYGLPLLLGAGEVRLLDLTNLYATLAQGGVHRPVQLVPGEPSEGARLFSEEAVELVTRILTEVRRPDLPTGWNLTRGVPEVAWKTGTSYGHRDAWAIGFSGHHTIGVWVGNFDGRAQKGISGSQHAGPLLFDLFRAIEEGGARIPERRFVRLGAVEVCATSRELPGPWCPSRTTITAIPGRTKLSRCSVHRRVFLDDDTGAILAGSCLAGRRHHPEVLSIFPAELVAWWRAQGASAPAAPPIHRECRDALSGEPPRIVSPGATTPYRIRREAPEKFQKIPLVARAAPSVGRLYWYEDGVLVAAAKPGASVFVAPERGAHRLVVVDDEGRSDALTYRVD